MIDMHQACPKHYMFKRIFCVVLVLRPPPCLKNLPIFIVVVIYDLFPRTLRRVSIQYISAFKFPIQFSHSNKQHKKDKRKHHLKKDTKNVPIQPPFTYQLSNFNIDSLTKNNKSNSDKLNPKHSMCGTYLPTFGIIWLFFMVTVGKYAIHWASGNTIWDVLPGFFIDKDRGSSANTILVVFQQTSCLEMCQPRRFPIQKRWLVNNGPFGLNKWTIFVRFLKQESYAKIGNFA